MPVQPLKARGLARPAELLLIAAAYFIAARLGLSLGIVEEVTAIWPPTGIALAALTIFGNRVWPGITLGALLANLLAGEPVGTALGIAAGNTLEALFGAWLLRRATVLASLDRLRDMLALVLLVCPLAPIVAATVGVASLCLGGVHPWSWFPRLFGFWWLGDAMGALLLVPALLTWSMRPRWRWRWTRAIEASLLFGGLLATSLLVFGAPYPSPFFYPFSFAYVEFPFIVWTALRFGQRGTSLAILLTSCVATWGTSRGLGPFGVAEVGSTWYYLQGFMAVVAITGLTLSSAISERNRLERHRAAEAAVARVLAESLTLREAAPRILEAICEGVDFDLGSLWTVEHESGVLRCLELWQRPTHTAEDFASASRQRSFAPGVGLPGRVWTAKEPVWIEDVVSDANFPRAPLAAREGLHGAFGFPVVLSGEVLGVIEFFSREVRRPDGELLRLVASVGLQIGQFIQRERAQEAVRSSEARKAGVLASVLDALVTIDHEGRVLEFNRGAELVFGWTAAEMCGLELAQRIIPERLREQHRQALARYPHGSSGAILGRRVEMPALRADGSEFLVELTVTPIEGSHPPQFTGYLRDITERKRGEVERARLLTAEQAARARAETLAQDLREQQEAKDRFLAMLGHELRNPLAPLANALQVLRMRPPGDPEVRELHEMMQRQVRHMARLVDDLLDVSRIARGSIELRREPLDLAELLAEVVETNRAFFDQGGHRLSVSIPPGPFPMTADATRLSQVVANLLSNAARYTPPGGDIRLSLERAPASGSAVDDALVRVRDSGIGIKPELLQRVFEPFTQGDRIPGSISEGLGLGLTLVKTLVELHGGSVVAESDGPGQGSEFVVRLPLGHPAAAADPLGAPRPGSAAPRAVRKRILVVDDNRDAADTLATLLGLAGQDTAVAYDGSEALEKFRSWRPEVVFLDIGLPEGMSGHELGRRMTDEALGHEVLLIALTGYGQEEDRQRSREAGFHFHLVKPIDPQDLQRILASLHE